MYNENQSYTLKWHTAVSQEIMLIKNNLKMRGVQSPRSKQQKIALKIYGKYGVFFMNGINTKIRYQANKISTITVRRDGRISSISQTCHLSQDHNL